MPAFSKSSNNKLETCHPDIQTLFHYVIKYFDCKVIYGHRGTNLQFELFQKGRKKIRGVWMIENKKEIITYCDGYKKKSEHRFNPSRAIDVIPYPIQWENTRRMLFFIGYVKGVAQMLYDYGAIDSKIVSGRDWDDDTILTDQTFNDFAHYQIKR